MPITHRPIGEQAMTHRVNHAPVTRAGDTMGVAVNQGDRGDKARQAFMKRLLRDVRALERMRRKVYAHL